MDWISMWLNTPQMPFCFPQLHIPGAVLSTTWLEDHSNMWILNRVRPCICISSWMNKSQISIEYNRQTYSVPADSINIMDLSVTLPQMNVTKLKQLIVIIISALIVRWAKYYFLPVIVANGSLSTLVLASQNWNCDIIGQDGTLVPLIL